MPDVGVAVRSEAAPATTSRNILRENLKNDVRLHMRSRIYGSVEPARIVLENSEVWVVPLLEAHTIYIWNERLFMFSNRCDRSLDFWKVNYPDMERHFKRPSRYRYLKFLEYFQAVLLYSDGTLPKRIRVGKDDLH